MAMGPAPKDPSQRARRNKDVIPTSRLPFVPFDPGPLPGRRDWHERTVALWNAWRNSPMATLMTEVDWIYMIDTALMHHTMWKEGRWEFAAEVRLRLAQFGATPLDRMRLRIVWADADNKDATIPQTANEVPPSRRRYEGLKPGAGNVTPISKFELPPVVEGAPDDTEAAGDRALGVKGSSDGDQS